MQAGHGHTGGGVFGLCNRRFQGGTLTCGAGVAGVVRRPKRALLGDGALGAARGWGYLRMPTGFLPTEDQGYVIVGAQTPPESSAGRTVDVVKRIEEHFAGEPAVARRTMLVGSGFSGPGPHVALPFVPLTAWHERGPHDGPHQPRPPPQYLRHLR